MKKFSLFLVLLNLLTATSVVWLFAKSNAVLSNIGNIALLLALAGSPAWLTLTGFRASKLDCNQPAICVITGLLLHGIFIATLIPIAAQPWLIIHTGEVIYLLLASSISALNIYYWAYQLRGMRPSAY